MYEIIKLTFAEHFRVWHTFPINNEEINGIQMSWSHFSIIEISCSISTFINSNIIILLNNIIPKWMYKYYLSRAKISLMLCYIISHNFLLIPAIFKYTLSWPNEMNFPFPTANSSPVLWCDPIFLTYFRTLFHKWYLVSYIAL